MSIGTTTDPTGVFFEEDERCTRIAAAEQGRVKSASLLATIHSRAREICGSLSCTSMHFQALSCNDRLPRSLRAVLASPGLQSAKACANVGRRGLPNN
jgi:hypothetical protein